MELSNHLHRWKNFIEKLKLTTLEKQILYNSNFSCEDGVLVIILDPSMSVLLTKASKENITRVIKSNDANRLKKIDLGLKPGFKREDTIAHNVKGKGVREDLVAKALENANVASILRELKGSKIIEVCET